MDIIGKFNRTPIPLLFYPDQPLAEASLLFCESPYFPNYPTGCGTNKLAAAQTGWHNPAGNIRVVHPNPILPKSDLPSPSLNRQIIKTAASISAFQDLFSHAQYPVTPILICQRGPGDSEEF